MKGYGKEQEVKAINSTIHFTSNDMLPNDEQTMSRLLFCEFKQNNFDFKKQFHSMKLEMTLLV